MSLNKNLLSSYRKLLRGKLGVMVLYFTNPGLREAITTLVKANSVKLGS